MTARSLVPRSRRTPLLLALPLALAAAGCVRTVPASTGPMAGLQPILSVERFLQAVNTGDLDAMARIFGNAKGPIADQTGSFLSCPLRRVGSWIGAGNPCVSWVEIEIRMDLIAQILRHDNYNVRSESPVPGRLNRTTRVGVDLTRGANQYQDVPFEVVLSSDGRWLIENVELQRITAD